MERSTYYKIATVIGVVALSQSAFSLKIRDIIKKRDGYKCRFCGSTEHIECGHIDHNKNNPRYNDASNGFTVCVEDHLKDHINRHGRNGLTKKQNEWAIERLKERLPTTIYDSADVE